MTTDRRYRSVRAASTWVVGIGLVALVVVFLARLANPLPTENSRHGELLAVFFLVLLVAEQFRLRMRGRLDTAPSAAATGLALALTAAAPRSLVPLQAVDIVSVALAAQAVDWLLVRYRVPAGHRGALAVDGALRLLSVTIIASVVHTPLRPGSDLTLAEELRDDAGWEQALVGLGLVAAVLCVELALRALPRARAEGTRFGRAARDEFRSGGALSAAVGASAVLVALCTQLLGLAAVPLLLIPLTVTQVAVRRRTTIAEVHLQTIRALSRMPELAQLVPGGHSRRVAVLSVAVGRELGMPERSIVDLEYAALLHDIGQVALRRPIPHGATVLAAPADQQRIADTGADLARQTGELSRVAAILAAQAVPYRQVVERRRSLDLASRIIKVVNAFEDYLGAESTGVGTPEAAVERLYLGLGYEFDPRVVQALERVLQRDLRPRADVAGLTGGAAATS